MRRALISLLVLTHLAPVASASHTSPLPGDELAEVQGPHGVDWRAVAFAPDGSYALVVGRFGDGGSSRDVIATWTTGEGLVEVHNATGAGLVDVTFHDDGSSLVLGVEDTILLGTPGNYRDVWDETTFAQSVPPLHFYGLRAAFQPGGDTALVAGSSLLRVDLAGEVVVVHGGRDSFFRSLAWNPISDFAFVEVALERDGQALLGAVWRTNGEELAVEDNVAIYGRHAPGRSLLNSISFAPNGTFAVLAGRDGAGSTVLTWANHRNTCHRHPGASDCHDHTWQYLPTAKLQGPITCVAFHPTLGYAMTAGLDRDVVGFVGTHVWAPLAHAGPQLLGCAFHPSGLFALAVGEGGAVLRVTPGAAPLAGVASPEPGALIAPDANATFLVGVLDRSGAGVQSVSGVVAGEPVAQARRAGPWWALAIDASELADGQHQLDVTASTGGGTTTFAHSFLVNNEAFTPGRPELRSPQGLEGSGLDADGVFTMRWRALDEPVVYEVEEASTDEDSNATRLIPAGSRDNLTIRVGSDGSYLYRVRAKNAFNVGSWSDGLVINVILDSDSDGVADARDPRPYLADTWGDTDADGVDDDDEYNQCSNASDAASTPGSDDDGDGIANGIECRQGSDTLDPDDPVPREADDGPDDGDEPPEEDNGTPVPPALVVVALAVAVGLRRRRAA